ncbi:unnamed protein product, partial [Meganyctiphanes norvegica]
MALQCNICCDTYTTSKLRRPRSLACGHTLCGVCATRMLVNGQIMCPVCKQSHKYQDIENITINHELEKVIERLSSTPTLTGAASAPTIPKSIPTPTGPKLHHGICDEHGQYKVHHCLTHKVFICSDCVVAYHLDDTCRRVPIVKMLEKRKVDLAKKIDSHLFSLQETGKQIEIHHNGSKDTELQINTQMEKLQVYIMILEQKMNICKKTASKLAELSTECEERQKQAQSSKDTVQGITTFLEVNSEDQWAESSEQKTQEWSKQVKDALEQTEQCKVPSWFEAMLMSGIFASLVRTRDTYATHTHEGVQRWGRILTRDGNIIMQDLRNNKPTNPAI